MKKLKNIYMKKKEGLQFCLGLLVVSLIALPYLLLGEGSYVQVHDQMDGEILNYIYQAKYLFRGDVIPEFMNGMDKASMTAPAPLGVLLYKILPPFPAFALMHWICLVTGFVGMFLLCRHCKLRAEVSFLTACIFCYIPFYPVYGLAALGQPLLVYSFLKLAEGERKRVRGLMPLLCITFYGCMSSLTLIGYVWVILGVLSVIVLLVRKKRAEAIRIGMGTAVLILIYLATNLDLLGSLFGKGFETHRSEMVLAASEDLLGKVKELLFTGGSYSPVYSAGILAAGILFLCVGAVLAWKCGRTECTCERKRLFRCMKATGGLFVVIFAGIFLAVLWNCQWIVHIRTAIGGMVAYFQADRVYWTFPFMWMFLMGWILEGMAVIYTGKTRVETACMEQACEAAVRKEATSKTDLSESGSGKKLPRLLRYTALGLGVILVLAEGLQVFRDNTLNKNLRLVMLENYEQITWESLYMEDVFKEIDRVIGDEKENVSVVSLGIYPSVALYNGYTCADGYSNNYDLEYKHAFRKIIAAELEKSPEAKAYFDDWGNRLYLAGQPYGINGMVAKGWGNGYEDVDFDVEAMKALNIGYLFSAAPVSFGEDAAASFELVEGSPFSDNGSYYEVWVYRIR